MPCGDERQVKIILDLLSEGVGVESHTHLKPALHVLALSQASIERSRVDRKHPGNEGCPGESRRGG
jgi:hypothetical protein